MRRFRLTESRRTLDQWTISVFKWGVWWPIEIRTGIDRAVSFMNEMRNNWHD
jgi:hypothetical protein